MQRTDLVRDWSARLQDRGWTPSRDWGVVPSAAERAVIADGVRTVADAARGLAAGSGSLTADPPWMDPPPADPPVLGRYLAGMAAGVAAAVAAEDADAPSWPAAGAALWLAAGLLAGSAAVTDPSGSGGSDAGLARVTRLAGEAAAERAVDGADVASVVWQSVDILRGGQPPARQPVGTDRDRVLLAAVLAALAPRDPEPGAVTPAVCGAGPGELTGTAFRAEIAFTAQLDPEQLDDLRTRLGERCDGMWMWPAHPFVRFHLHTSDPAGCLAAAYAAGQIWELGIAAMGADTGADG